MIEDWIDLCFLPCCVNSMVWFSKTLFCPHSNCLTFPSTFLLPAHFLGLAGHLCLWTGTLIPVYIISPFRIPLFSWPHRHYSVLTSNLATAIEPSLVILLLHDDFSVLLCSFSLTQDGILYWHDRSWVCLIHASAVSPPWVKAVLPLHSPQCWAHSGRLWNADWPVGFLSPWCTNINLELGLLEVISSALLLKSPLRHLPSYLASDFGIL